MKEIPFYKPSINHKESKQINDVLDMSDAQSKVQKLEESFANYVGAKYAIATSSGTAAMHLALCALDLKRGDKIIVCVNSFVSTAEVVRHFDAEPVFVDVDSKTFSIDIEALQKVLATYPHKKLRAIFVSHVAGLISNIQEVIKIAKEHKIEVIQDASHALGATTNRKKIGQLGSVASTFSFSPHRSSGIINGGMLISDDANIIKRARLLRNHAIDTDGWDKHGSLDYIYDVVDIGCKYDMSELHAAFALAQLAKNDEFIKRRQEIAKIYSKELEGVSHITLPIKSDEHIYFHYIIKVDKNRDHFARKMKEKGISTGLHFIPLHLLSYYKQKYELKVNAFPHALSNYQQILSLPIYPRLSDDEVLYICKAIKEIVKNRV
jgi:dTDP-4-amino-4,6-dideoxygalactose transaminase